MLFSIFSQKLTPNENISLSVSPVPAMYAAMYLCMYAYMDVGVCLETLKRNKRVLGNCFQCDRCAFIGSPRISIWFSPSVRRSTWNDKQTFHIHSFIHSFTFVFWATMKTLFSFRLKKSPCICPWRNSLLADFRTMFILSENTTITLIILTRNASACFVVVRIFHKLKYILCNGCL